MAIIRPKKIFVCDRCGKRVESDHRPNHASDPWGTLIIDQPSGYDYQGCAWAPRMRKAILLCGNCVEDVIAVVNEKVETKP